MSDETKTTQTTAAPVKAGLSTQKVVLILGAVAIVCAAVVIAIFLLNQEDEGPGRVITAENVEEIAQDIQEQVERGMFATYMNTTWTFPDGRSPSSDAVMGNSARNRYPFYFTVVLSETDETIFESGLLPIGTRISQIVLDRELAAGDYPAIVYVNMIDENDEPVENNVNFGITLRILR